MLGSHRGQQNEECDCTQGVPEHRYLVDVAKPLYGEEAQQALHN